MTHEASEELILLVGSMDGKLDIILEQHKDQTSRLGRLEKDRNRIVGAFIGLSALLTWATHDKLPALLELFR